MFRPKYPSSGVQFVVFQDSAAQCNAVFSLVLLLLLPLVILVMWVARGCFSVTRGNNNKRKKTTLQ
jgi:hypothetical protein